MAPVTRDSPIRLMIVDDHPVVRAGIASLLANRADITVVAGTDNAAEALELCGQQQVDIVLMDLALPEVDGVTATSQLSERYPDVRVIVLTGFVDDTAVRAAVQAGAVACLLKSAGEHGLVEAIRGAMQGRSTFSAEFLPQLVAPDARGLQASTLTPRELEILALVADGYTNKGIAQALGLTDGTVRIYVSTILGKLGVANRTEATVVAIQQGILEPPKCSR